MTPARRALALLLAAAASLLPRAGRAAEPERPAEAPAAGGDHAVSPEGHPFRVRFDPASRVWVGSSYGLGVGGDGAIAHAARIDLGLSYRGRHVAGAGLGRVVWQVDHRVLAGWIAPAARPIEGVPALDASVYAASLLRHDESPSVVLPLSPPVSVPFPFDIGLDAEVGRVSIPATPPAAIAGGAPAPVIRAGVVRASAVLDPWRTGEPGDSLEIGFGVRYDVDAYPADGAPPRIIHRVAPMTAGSLRFRLQSEDGLTVLDCRGDFIPHWTSEDRWRVAVLSSARVERALAAVEDEPIALVLDGGYRLSPATGETLAQHDVRVTLGLTFNLQLN